MKKEGAYNGMIQNAIAELFETITPYVYHEARWGFADSLVYIPDRIISEKIQQDVKQKNGTTEINMITGKCENLRNRGGN
jgi:hypothetical protein